MARDADDERAPQGDADRAEPPAWATGDSLLELLATRSPVGIVIVDTDLRCAWSNTALEQFGGGTVPERLGRRLGDIHPALEAQAIESKMRQVLETGKPLIGYVHMGRTSAEPQLRRAFSLSFVRLEDAEGTPLGVLYTVTDVTPRQRARLRLALLDRAGRYIGRTLDLARTAQELADVAIPQLADFVTVDLLHAIPRAARPARPARRRRPGDAAPRRAPVGRRRVAPRSWSGSAGRGRVPGPVRPPARCLTTGHRLSENAARPAVTGVVSQTASAARADLPRR